MKGIAVALLLLLLLTASGYSQVPDDKLIVPGQRIGKWTLAMSIDDVARMNGYPGTRFLARAGSPSVEAGADLTRDVTVFEWGVVFAATLDGKRVRALAISAAAQGGMGYKTARGIGLQSTRAQVLKAYGRPTAETKPAPGEVRLIYDKIGIWFRFFSSGGVRSISVFRPGTAKRVWKF